MCFILFIYLFYVHLFIFLRYASWLSVGDFDVNIKASVGNIYACYDIRFAVKPKPKI